MTSGRFKSSIGMTNSLFEFLTVLVVVLDSLSPQGWAEGGEIALDVPAVSLVPCTASLVFAC